MSTDPTAVAHAFASDNYAGVHQEVLDAVIAANTGHVTAYGGDPWTARFQEITANLFGEQAEAFPVFNGTGANVISLQAAIPRWGAVIAPATSHINNDEGGAPEKVGGVKILGIRTHDGKLTPALAKEAAWGWGDPHRAQPLAISISQVSELGTCYTPEEVEALAQFAHSHGMVLHMDGSRLANAAAYLGVPLSALTTDVGVDILSLGATKNGAMGAEAIIVINPSSVRGIEYLRKTNMQLGSKMRFISAQLIAMYEGDLWLRSAQQANQRAASLAEGLRGQVPIPFPVESNVVFAELSSEQKERARRVYRFYDWPGSPDLVRLMCSFDTSGEDVRQLVDAICDR